VVNCLTPILFYYLFLTLILQYVNELFVRILPTLRSETVIPFLLPVRATK
jgi:hypothetical protein